MPKFVLDIVTPERVIYSDQVDAVNAPGIEGELGILPHHCPLITLLQPGEINIKKSGEEILIAVAGGFLEVRPDRVIILADVAERDDEVDALKAEEAKRQAEKELRENQVSVVDKAKAEAALRLNESKHYLVRDVSGHLLGYDTTQTQLDSPQRLHIDRSTSLATGVVARESNSLKARSRLKYLTGGVETARMEGRWVLFAWNSKTMS